MIYVTSDLHLFHNKPFLYEPRGFASIEEHNEAIIQNWNNLISEDDDIYVLGDLLLGGADTLESGLQLISSLKGRLHFVRGNHDSNKRWEAYKTLSNVIEQETAMYLKYKKYHFYLSHFPTLTSNIDDKGLAQRTLNLCGHSHTKDKWADWDKGYIYHCELDAHNNIPVSLDTIIEDFKIQHNNVYGI